MAACVLACVLSVASASSAKAIPWLWKTHGVLGSGALVGMPLSAEFIYEDGDLPARGDGKTPIIHASIKLNNQRIFDQAYPGGHWPSGMNTKPSGVETFFFLSLTFSKGGPSPWGAREETCVSKMSPRPRSTSEESGGRQRRLSTPLTSWDRTLNARSCAPSPV